MHENTPSLLIVNGPRLLEYAKELVVYMVGKADKKETTPKDYRVNYIDKKKPIQMNLFKVKKG